MTFTPTHHITIENKPLWIFDDLCTQAEAESLFKGLQVSAFKRDEIARPDTQEYRHWAVNLTSEQIRTLPVYHRAIEAIRGITKQDFSAYRGYVNHASY